MDGAMWKATRATVVALTLGWTLLSASGCKEQPKQPLVDLGPGTALASVAPSDGKNTQAFNPRLLRRFKALRSVLAEEGKQVSSEQIAL
jgi:hypothetical protein